MNFTNDLLESLDPLYESLEIDTSTIHVQTAMIRFLSRSLKGVWCEVAVYPAKSQEVPEWRVGTYLLVNKNAYSDQNHIWEHRMWVSGPYWCHTKEEAFSTLLNLLNSQ